MSFRIEQETELTEKEMEKLTELISHKDYFLRYQSLPYHVVMDMFESLENIVSILTIEKRKIELKNQYCDWLVEMETTGNTPTEAQIEEMHRSLSEVFTDADIGWVASAVAQAKFAQTKINEGFVEGIKQPETYDNSTEEDKPKKQRKQK